MLINGRPAHRLGDPTTHCGGSGSLVTGSSNVLIGGPAGAKAADDLDDEDERLCVRVQILYAETEKPVADEAYDLLDVEDNVVRSGRTDAEGRLEQVDLERGMYRVRLESEWVIRG